MDVGLNETRSGNDAGDDGNLLTASNHSRP